ncbi:MAG: hypothetical protein LW854_19880 [Rubrivivax sp.]|jgi:hypothetical protein|nr:hypothetical protein [Rubrivivax sp.]
MLPKEAPNPFGHLINPDSVAKAIEASERLSRLQSRVCRPLDRPLIPNAKAMDPAVAAFDAAIERASATRRAMS